MSPNCNSLAWYPPLEKGRRNPTWQVASQWKLGTVTRRGGEDAEQTNIHVSFTGSPPGFPALLASKPSPGDLGFHQYLPPAFINSSLWMAPPYTLRRPTSHPQSSYELCYAQCLGWRGPNPGHPFLTLVRDQRRNKPRRQAGRIWNITFTIDMAVRQQGLREWQQLASWCHTPELGRLASLVTNSAEPL